MSVSMLFIAGLCTFQTIVIIWSTVHYRKQLTKMTGMLIAMALGMAVGTLAGTILGIIYHGNLFESTVFAILAGLSIGAIAGMPIGLSAVIEGMLSGLMGGMMGAMLGDMVAMTRPDTMIKILSLIVTMILLLVLYAMEDSIRKQSKRVTFSFFKRPYLLLFVIALLFIGLTFLEAAPVEKLENHNHLFTVWRSLVLI